MLDTMPLWFGAVFVGAGVIILLGFVVVIALIVRNVRKVRAGGHDPFTLQADLATRALDSAFLAPATSTEERLAEVDRLRAAGSISDEEHRAARARILGG